MKLRFIFSLALCGVGLVAIAADSIWEPWGNSDDGRWYMLKGSLQYDSGTASHWAMKDLPKPKRADNGSWFKSLRVQYLYDCKELSQKPIFIKGYSEQMGTGVEVFADYVGHDAKPTVFSPTDWERRGYKNFCKRAWEFWK